MPKKKVTSNSNAEKASNVQQEKCAEIMGNLNNEISQKCQSKQNNLDKCTTCEITNKGWVQINSKFDAQLLNTAYDGAGGFIPSGSGVDSQWEVGIGNASGPSSVTTWIPAFVYKNAAWTPSPFNNANWISMYDNGKHSGNKVYYYASVST